MLTNRLMTPVVLALVVVIFLFTAAAQAVTIDMVPVGNPGNAPDTRYDATGFGSVAYNYQIGKYEVTAGQYTQFLNAVAKDDPNGLYNSAMGDTSDNVIGGRGANIQRAGFSPDYIYSVDTDWANRAVNYVGFWDAARFANWLHNGQPTGPQSPGTTEDGAYHDVGNSILFGRNAGARYFIPTQDEWYKAAYHKNDGVTGNYWDYPTMSDAAPINTLPDTGNHANLYDHFGIGNGTDYTIGGPYYRTEVGEFENSASPYGTFDQAGNVVEWSETLERCSASLRWVHGGSYERGIESDTLEAYRLAGASPRIEWPFYGFRVASLIPEPGTLLLSTMAFAGLLLKRR